MKNQIKITSLIRLTNVIFLPSTIALRDFTPLSRGQLSGLELCSNLNRLQPQFPPKGTSSPKQLFCRDYFRQKHYGSCLRISLIRTSFIHTRPYRSSLQCGMCSFVRQLWIKLGHNLSLSWEVSSNSMRPQRLPPRMMLLHKTVFLNELLNRYPSMTYYIPL